jgi:hypothetical protein
MGTRFASYDQTGGSGMSSVIEFLERMGKEAELRFASPEEIAQAVADAQIESALGAAIIAKSTSELYALLHQGPMFHVQQNPGKEEEEEDEDDENEDEEPSQKKSARVEFRSNDLVLAAST